jgi:hypothetical protein
LDSYNDLPDWHEIVLITTQEDLDKFHPQFPLHIKMVICSLSQPVEEIYLLLIQKINKIGKPDKMIIGIDPGMHETGIALFVNDKFVSCEVTYTRIQFVDCIKLYFKMFHAGYKIIKIGNGYARNTRYLLNYFFSKDFTEKNVNFFLVNEKASSQAKHNLLYRTLSAHEKAAISIASRYGKPLTKANLNQILNVKVPKSAIRGIQYESRYIAHKHKVQITIDSEDAKDVYLGKKSVDESMDLDND